MARITFRRLARWFAIALATLLVVVMAAVVVVETAWFKNKLRLELVGRVSDLLNGELRVGRLSGSLWTGVLLEEVEVAGADGSLIRAASIRVRYNPLTLIGGRWIIDHVRLERADINIIDTPAGWNVATLVKPRKSSGGEPPTIVIEELELADSTVTITPLGADPRRLTGVNLDSSLRIADRAASMNVASLVAHDERTGLTLREFTAAASDNFRVFNSRFAAESPAMTIAGTARGEMDGAARVIHASVDTSRVNLAVLTGNPALETHINGRTDATVRLRSGREPTGSFAFSGRDTRALGYEAQSLDATGTFAGAAINFDARASAYGARATVDGSWVPSPRGRGGRFNGRGTFASLDLRRLPAQFDIPRLDSLMSGRFSATASPGAWRAYAAFSTARIEGATLAPGTEAYAASSGGRIDYGAVGGVSGLDLRRLGYALDVEPLTADRFSSRLSGRFFVAGEHQRGATPVIAGGMALEQSFISGTSLPQLSALTLLAERQLMVRAQGRFEHLNPVEFGLETTATEELEEEEPDFMLAGDLHGWFAIHDLEQPMAADNMEGGILVGLRPSTVRGHVIESATLNAHVLDGAVWLTALDVVYAEGDAVLHAEGTIGIDEPFGQGILLTSTINDRTLPSRLSGKPVFAAGTVDATIAGSIASPSASGTLALHEAAYSEAFSALTFNGTFKADWPDRTIDRLQWDVRSRASFAQVGGVDVQQLTANAGGGTREMAVDLQFDQQARSLGIRGELTLEPESQQLLLQELAFTSGTIAWGLRAGQVARVTYGGDRIEVADLTLTRGAQSIGVSGGFDLEAAAAGAPARPALELRFQNVEVADINQALLGTRQFAGQVNGIVSLAGSRETPRVDADVTISGGSVEGVAYDRLLARGQYAAGQATIDMVLDQSPGVSLRAAGTIPIASEAPNPSIDVRVTGGPINLGLVQALTTEIDNVTGEAAVDLRLTGLLRDLRANGTLTLTKGAFDVTGTGVRYQGLEAALAFDGTRVDVKQLRIADVDGNLLTAAGGLDVLGATATRAVNVTVTAANLAVLDNAFGTASVDLNLAVSGTLGAPVIRGTATLQDGRLEVAEILERTTSTPYSTTPLPAAGAEEKREPTTPFTLADVQLDVSLPDNLVLRGRGLRVSNGGLGIGDMNIVTGGSFSVRKPPNAALDVRGTLEVVRGNYSFQGRRFEIERGSDVRFAGGPPTDPFLNVTATREVAGIVAEVRLRGSARAPDLVLSSRPPLDEGDILSLIVFNQPVNSLDTNERVNLGQRAASIAAGAITTPLSDSIARALNLDLFEIQAPTSEENAGAVTIGGQLGSRVFVGVRQTFGHAESSQLTLEYRVNEMLRFVTSIARGTLQAHATRRTERSGVDLIFVIRY
jgi:autotransporter translocation and assembly factor TamB